MYLDYMLTQFAIDNKEVLNKAKYKFFDNI